MRSTLIAAVLLVFLAGCKMNTADEGYVAVIETGSGEHVLDVELARTDEELEKGLMFRERLDEGQAMLFIFPSEEVRPFWMKNTLIPLDIIFISSAKVIVDIKTAEPCHSGS